MKKILFAFAVIVGMCVSARAANNCTGATYYDSDSDTCIACPAGYDYNQDAGKTDITQCQVHCDAGTYVELSGEYTQLEYIESTGTQYINTEISEADIEYIELDFEAQSGGGYMFVNGSTQVGMQDNRYGTTTLNTRYKIKQELVGNKWYFTNITNGTTFTQPWAAGSGNLYLFALNRSSHPDNYSSAKVYGFSCYSNGSLVCNFIPARRNNDGVIGMYDTVTGTFFPNAGTGTFIAGSDIGGWCANVGAGYYAGASTVNYGSVGTRTACPAGTSTNGADNASACTPCANATYNDETGMASCKSCPTGYNYNQDAGKTDISQCQVHCDAGTYIDSVGIPVPEDYTPLEYIESTGTQYIDTGIIPRNYNYSAEFTMSASAFGKYFFGTGTSDWGGSGYQFGIANSGGSSSWGGGSASTVASGLGVSTNTFYTYKITKNGFYVNDVLKSAISNPADFAVPRSLYVGRSNKPNGGSYNNGRSKWSMVKIYDDNGAVVFDGVPARRNGDGVAGMYDTITGTFFTNSGTGTFVAGADAGATGNGCVNVGAEYYAPASTVNYGSVGTRTACPVGLYTVGYGHGADDANDCGRILHVGDNVIYTRRNKETTPSVNIQMTNGDMFYISLSPTDHTVSRLHFSYGGNEYTAYDDSLFYGERDFDTGQQISQ